MDQLPAQRGASIRQQRVADEKENSDVARAATHAASPLSDFSKIPLFRSVVGQGNDPLEHEADRVTHRLARMLPDLSTAPAPAQLSRKCVSCPSESPQFVREVLSTPGQPLDSATRAFFEPRVGHDLSSVRVHADRQASEAAGGVAAQAFTVGRNIVFGRGHYAPETERGRQLLAHELTHVVQQGGDPLRLGISRAPNSIQRKPDEDLEGLLKQLDFDLIDKRGAADRQKQQSVAQGGQAQWNRDRPTAMKPIYDIQERKAAVKALQAGPKGQKVLFDVKVVAIEMPPSQGSLKTQIVDLRDKNHGGVPRTFDNLVYVANDKGEVLGAMPIELKSEGAQTEKSLLASSVQGGVNKGDIEAKYRPKSTIAGQITKTASLRQHATDVGGVLVLMGRDAVTGKEVTIRVRPEALSQERITSYGRLPDVLAVPVTRPASPGPSRTPGSTPTTHRGEEAHGGGHATKSGEHREPGKPTTPLAPVSPKAQQTQGEFDNPPTRTTPAGEKHEPSVIVDPSLEESEHKQPSAPPALAQNEHEEPAAPKTPTTEHETADGPDFVPTRFRFGQIAEGEILGLVGDYLSGKISGYFQRRSLRKQIAELEPEIDEQKQMALEGCPPELRKAIEHPVWGEGRRFYWVTTIRIRTTTVTGVRSPTTTSNEAQLVSVKIAEKEISRESGVHHDKTVVAPAMIPAVVSQDSHKVTYSQPIVSWSAVYPPMPNVDFRTGGPAPPAMLGPQGAEPVPEELWRFRDRLRQ
jgi:hypothetical protein